VKRFLPWVFLLALLVVLQSVMGRHLEVYHVKPDFFLISVLLVAMRRGSTPAALWGAVLGLVQDVLSGGVIGLNFLTKPAAGYAVGLLRARLDFDNPNTQTLVTLSAAAAEGLALAVLLNAYHPAKPVTWSLYSFVLPGAVYNGLLVPLLLAAGGLAGRWQEEWRRRSSRLAE
jgi:rod shape-determining protein MreD